VQYVVNRPYQEAQGLFEGHIHFVRNAKAPFRGRPAAPDGASHGVDGRRGEPKLSARARLAVILLLSAMLWTSIVAAASVCLR
jgi:hypothetical protein